VYRTYRMPARTADAMRSAGSVARCGSRRHRHSTKNTPSTVAALTRNTGPGPPATMTTPAMAGPTARATLIATVPSPTLAASSSFGTTSGRASRNSGRVVATCTSETISGEGVSNVINQAAAESCIHVPMLETTSEIHSARNSGRRNGLHAEGAVILANLAKRADPSTLDAAVEHRLHVDDRRPVERLQVADAHSRALNGENPHPVQSDRVGAVRRTGGEHTLQWVSRLAPRMDGQHVAPGAIEPRQHNHLVTDLQVAQSLAEPGVENQPGLRRAFVALPGRGRPIDERSFDPADRLQLVALVAQPILPMRSLVTSWWVRFVNDIRAGTSRLCRSAAPGSECESRATRPGPR